MYVKLAFAALFVCTLYNSAYSSLLECDDTDNPGDLVTSIIENNPANRKFKLRAPEDGETETPISCIIFASAENTYHVEITKGGLGENFVELEVYTIDADDDDDRDDRDDDDDDDDDDEDEFALAYRFTVFRTPDDDDDDDRRDDDDDRRDDDDDDRRDDDDDDDHRHHH